MQEVVVAMAGTIYLIFVMEILCLLSTWLVANPWHLICSYEHDSWYPLGWNRYADSGHHPSRTLWGSVEPYHQAPSSPECPSYQDPHWRCNNLPERPEFVAQFHSAMLAPGQPLVGSLLVTKPSPDCGWIVISIHLPRIVLVVSWLELPRSYRDQQATLLVCCEPGPIVQQKIERISSGPYWWSRIGWSMGVVWGRTRIASLFHQPGPGGRPWGVEVVRCGRTSGTSSEPTSSNRWSLWVSMWTTSRWSPVGSLEPH